MFEALGMPDSDWLQADLRAPVLVVKGALDGDLAPAHVLHDRLPNAELVVLEGAGHACRMEQPWEFDRQVIRFLRSHGHTHLPTPT